MNKKIITLGTSLLLITVITIPIINAQNTFENKDLNRPILYHGFVRGKYTKISSTGIFFKQTVEVRSKPGELIFQLSDVTWLDIVFFFGYAKDGDIFGLGLFVYVYDWL
jgi:hypothetical protein